MLPGSRTPRKNGGEGYEDIADIEDRIGFIKEDNFNQEGDATKKQNKDIAAMEKRIKKLENKIDKAKKK